MTEQAVSSGSASSASSASAVPRGPGPGPAVRPTGDTLAVSVHGPRGVLDLVVPSGATGIDVAREYAREARMDVVPHLHDALGRPVAARHALVAAGVEPGDVLVATSGEASGETERTPALGRGAERVRPGRLSALWFCVAAALALLAGWWAGQAAPSTPATATTLVLGATALLAAAPVGQLAGQRAVAAPAFGAAAALAVVWQPGGERLPMVLGVAALGGAVTAAVARAWRDEHDEALTVWMIAGGAVFVTAGVAAVAGARPSVVWSLLLVVAMMASRFVPALAVDVPDQVLLDLDRLAITAWSARDTRRGRRTRMLVGADDAAELVARGSRLVTAAAAAIAVVALVSAPMLLATATPELDRIGARLQVLLAGAALLLAARSYRHRGARGLLRAAGLVCWAAVAPVLLGVLAPTTLLLLGIGVVLVGGLCVAVGIATGHGWRSVWWSRRAEQAEVVSGAVALASVLVATGAFRVLWELTS